MQQLTDLKNTQQAILRHLDTLQTPEAVQLRLLTVAILVECERVEKAIITAWKKRLKPNAPPPRKILYTFACLHWC